MNEMIKMVVTLTIICGISGLTLASVRDATAPQIEEQVLTYVQGPSITDIFGATDNNPVKDRKDFKLADGSMLTVFPALNGGKLKGIAFESKGKGYGGEIGIMVGIQLDDTARPTLAGIGVTTMKETPGLGARIVESDFRDQFRGHSFQNIALASQGGDIDAVSGATISSTGTVSAVNSALKIFEQIKPQIMQAWKQS